MSVPPEHEKSALDTAATLAAVVGIRATIPDDGLTAPMLGTERSGNGVVIGDDGLVVTIGYLITEAQTLWITDAAGHAVPGHVVGYDQETGLGVAQALQPLEATTLALGDSARARMGDPVVVAGYGGEEQTVSAQIVAKREFAGYWEYVLDEALFTAPAHPNWGGAGVIGMDGRLLGVGSLLVQTVAAGGETGGANMIVPIDLLKPILDDLRTYGRPNRPARPWLGMLVQDIDNHLVVAGVYHDCPAQRAGLKDGDIVLSVGGHEVSELAELFRSIWRLGPAGVDVPLTIVRDGERHEPVLASVDRNDRLNLGRVH